MRLFAEIVLYRCLEVSREIERVQHETHEAQSAYDGLGGV